MKILIIIVLLTVVSLNSTMAQTSMQKLEWIVDRWLSTSGESISYEHWDKISDELITGGSETIKNGDTLFSEKLKIVKEDDEIFYIAEVSHNLMPVRFKLTSISDTEAVFENTEHDFPHKITYRFTDGDLHASIEGPGKSGNWKKVDFIMKKMR